MWSVPVTWLDGPADASMPDSLSASPTTPNGAAATINAGDARTVWWGCPSPPHPTPKGPLPGPADVHIGVRPSRQYAHAALDTVDRPAFARSRAVTVWRAPGRLPSPRLAPGEVSGSRTRSAAGMARNSSGGYTRILPGPRPGVRARSRYGLLDASSTPVPRCPAPSGLPVLQFERCRLRAGKAGQHRRGGGATTGTFGCGVVTDAASSCHGVANLAVRCGRSSGAWPAWLPGEPECGAEQDQPDGEDREWRCE
jgi:hypothetical protein